MWTCIVSKREMKKESEKDVGMRRERNLGGEEGRKRDGQMEEQEVKRERGERDGRRRQRRGEGGR